MNPETVKNYFDNPLVVADYAYAAENVGLWNSERIVFEKYIPKSSKIIEFGCGAQQPISPPKWSKPPQKYSRGTTRT